MLKTLTEIKTPDGTIDPFERPGTTESQFEHCWSPPPKIGQGFFYKVTLKTGFELYVMDCLFKKCPIFRAQANPSVVCLRFNLTGQNTVQVKGVNKAFSTTAQTNSLFYFQNPKTSGMIKENLPVRAVSLHFDPYLFFNFMSQENLLPPVLKKIAMGANIPFFCHTSTTTPNMQVTIQQIIKCPYQEMTRKIFLESKALELLAYKLNQMDAKQNQTSSHSGCSPDAFEKIRFAREILLREMESPPSLFELGKTVGLSRTKLHTEFCRAFGITPFAFLRDARLNKAKLYLDEGMMNVTEAAMAVGYSSISHFAKAFKRHFGVTPSDCQASELHLPGYQNFSG